MLSSSLQYRSANAPDKRDVLGAWMRGLLAGHQHYTHITALRADALAAQALDMNRVVSKDALRRALERINEAASTAWMGPVLQHSVRPSAEPTLGAGHRYHHQAVVQASRRC